MRIDLLRAGRWVGTISGIVALVLLLSFFLRVESTGTQVVLGGMCMLALAAAAAAWFGSPGALAILFVLSFVPAGFYFLGVPGWLKWAGVAQVGYLASAALIWVGGRSVQKVEPGGI